MDLEKLRNTSTSELEAMRSLLLKQLGRIGPLVDGSTLVAHHTCGNKNGKKLAQMRVQRSYGGKLHAVHVPRDLEETVNKWNAEYRRAQKLLHDIGDVSEQIIRNYTPDKRAARRAAKTRSALQIVPGEDDR